MKRKYYITVAAGLILAVVLSLFFAMRAENGVMSDDRLKIGVFVYKGDDTFISSMTESMKNIADRYEEDTGEHIYMSIVDAQGSQTTQNGQIERYISLGYDVLCVNLVDRTSAVYVIDKAMEADVPVVFFNREPVQADMQKWDKLYYVGTDASLNGKLQGQIIVDEYYKNPSALDKNGDGVLQYIMLEGEFRHQDAVLRTEGSVRTITEAGIRMERLDGGVADWVRSQAAALTSEYFDKYGKQIELIICNNDDMALGVLDIVKERGLDFINIVGIDGTPQGLKAVEEGRMLGTVVIDYDSQANLIFETANALLAGLNPEYAVEGMEERCVRASMYVATKNMNTVTKS